MQKIRDAIIGKERWEILDEYITLIEQNKNTNPNIALDAAKSLLESISKTILEDKNIAYDSDSKVGKLVKKAFDSLPVFSKISEKDQISTKSILGSLENLSKAIGEFRNRHGFFSHGQDLQSEKFDQYLVELAISSADLLSSFLIVSHSEDLKDRKRIYYEENTEFNKYIDEISEEPPVVMGIQLSPSNALFSDLEAYKEELLSFVNKKVELIAALESSEKFVTTRSICSDLIDIQNYLTNVEVKQIVRAAINNPQIHRILGHGYTKNLYLWIVEERMECLTENECNNLREAFSKKMY